MMPGAGIFFTVVIAAIVTKNIVNSASIQDIDVDKIVDIVQQNRLNRNDRSDDSDSSEDSDSSDEYRVRSGKTEEDEIINALKLLFSNKNNKQSNRDHSVRQKANNVVNLQNYDSRISQVPEDTADILSALLNNDLRPEPKSQPRATKKRLIPNRLLWDANNKNDDDQDYSKIYVLLTPKAIQKTKLNRSGVNQLISKILSLSSSSSKRDRQAPKKQNRYKGFVINEHFGRRRGSREMYAPKDSSEDAPKRSRNNGGGGGHTAIPYIRHRGDNIYEKDS